jgi:hypothetical protein
VDFPRFVHSEVRFPVRTNVDNAGRRKSILGNGGPYGAVLPCMALRAIYNNRNVSSIPSALRWSAVRCLEQRDIAGELADNGNTIRTVTCTRT